MASQQSTPLLIEPVDETHTDSILATAENNRLHAEARARLNIDIWTPAPMPEGWTHCWESVEAAEIADARSDYGR